MIRIDEKPSGAVRGALGGQLKNSHPVNCPTGPRGGEAPGVAAQQAAASITSFRAARSWGVMFQACLE